MNEADVLTNIDYFSVNSEGELIFTEQGIAEYRSYFGKADVDIRNIKSLEDFRRARRAASPFFEDHLAEKSKMARKRWKDGFSLQLPKAMKQKSIVLSA
jgi:hypothetical protein